MEEQTEAFYINIVDDLIGQIENIETDKKKRNVFLYILKAIDPYLIAISEDYEQDC